MQQSYAEKAARERLAILQQQMTENTQFQSALSNKVKNLRRKDFEQQIQPLYTQVEFKGGLLAPKRSDRVWGKITGPRGLKSGGTTGTMLGSFLPSSSSKKEKPIGLSGSMNIVSPSAQWTTEGYMETGPKIEPLISQEIKGTVQSKRRNKRKGFIDSNQFKVERLNYPGE